MSKATPATHKAVRRPRCKYCQKQFRTTSIKKIYCAPQCQKEATKKKRRVSRTNRATHSAFFYHLAYECERAGTLQILTGHTVESLVALYDVYKLKLKANRYGETKDYEISHIHPVQSDSDAIGLFHPENLVVVPTKLNREHGTQHYGHGLSINRSALVSKHSVEKGAPRKQTVQRIIAFLGADVVAEAVKIAKIQPTQRHKVLSWLHDHLDPTVPEQRAQLDNLDDMTTIALTGLKAALEGKESSGFTIKTRTYGPLEVLLLGLEQQVQYRPELIEVHDAIYAALSCLISEDFSSEWVPYWSLIRMVEALNSQPSLRAHLSAPELLQALFDVLHGKAVDAIRPMLEVFAERPSGAVERIPPYKPIVFKAQRPARVVATVQAPISVAADARSFAEFLDGEGQDDVPMLLPLSELCQMAPLADSVEPLPWD